MKKLIKGLMIVGMLSAGLNLVEPGDADVGAPAEPGGGQIGVPTIELAGDPGGGDVGIIQYDVSEPGGGQIG